MGYGSAAYGKSFYGKADGAGTYSIQAGGFISQKLTASINAAGNIAGPRLSLSLNAGGHHCQERPAQHQRRRLHHRGSYKGLASRRQHLAEAYRFYHGLCSDRGRLRARRSTQAVPSQELRPTA